MRRTKPVQFFNLETFSSIKIISLLIIILIIITTVITIMAKLFDFETFQDHIRKFEVLAQQIFTFYQ